MARAKASHSIGDCCSMTKLAMPSLCAASATKPERSPAASSMTRCGSSAPFTAMSMVARGLRLCRRWVSRSTVAASARSVFEITSRSARIACLRASAALPSADSPLTASTTVSTWSMWNSPPSARSVEKVCRIGPGSARPLVSITMRRNGGTTPCSRSNTRRRSAACRSVRVMQQTQPLPSSTVSSALSRTSTSSMPTAPNSLMMTAVPWPSGEERKRCNSVVLPLPRNPVTTVTGIFAPRSRLSRRPNGPASREGKRSSMDAG